MKKYSVIYADPPWRYKVYSKKGLGRSAESHYPTMSLEDIKALPIGELAADVLLRHFQSQEADCRDEVAAHQ